MITCATIILKTCFSTRPKSAAIAGADGGVARARRLSKYLRSARHSQSFQDRPLLIDKSRGIPDNATSSAMLFNAGHQYDTMPIDKTTYVVAIESCPAFFAFFAARFSFIVITGFFLVSFLLSILFMVRPRGYTFRQQRPPFAPCPIP